MYFVHSLNHLILFDLNQFNCAKFVLIEYSFVEFILGKYGSSFVVYLVPVVRPQL